jgi:O-antigen/teichoic acid export membrane protein
MMGLYSELMLIFEYSRFHHLGMINAMEREVPFFNGKKEFKKVEEIKKTALAFIILSAVNIGAILFILSFFADIHKVGLRFLSALVIIETVVSFYKALLQSYNRFKLWSLFIVGIGFLDAVLKIFLVIKFGLNGLLAALVLTGIISIATYYFLSGCRVDFGARIYFREIWRMLKIGIPLIIFRVLYALSISIDRLAIIFFLGRLQLGYYSIATMVSNYLILMPKFSFRTLYPKFIEAFGKSENVEDVRKFLITPNRIFACFFSALIGLAVIAIPFLVTYLLPRFKEGIFAAQVVAFAAFFSALIYTWNYLLIALYKQKRLVPLYGLGAIIALVANLFFIKVLNMQINGVALATLTSQFIFTTILICYGYRHYTKNFLEHLKLVSMLYAPFLLIVVAMVGRKFYYPKGISFKTDLLSVLITCFIFLIIFAPFLYYIVKKERLSHYLFKPVEKNG